MTELTAAHFSDFYQAVHGYEPFVWQKRLAEHVLGKEGWPDVIRVPTSSGKSSVLDIALFELAAKAGRQAEERPAARRICFVIDRRLVVDEITEHAHRLYQAIMRNPANGDQPILPSVKAALASLAADREAPLRVVRLRGAVYRDDGWAADPLTPTIIISTVDQIGSRLLFRGYGVSRRSRPVQAGLLAFDTRIILDEAHLSTVFAETLDRIRQYQQWAEQSPLPKERLVSVVRMSATAGDGQHVFELTDEERTDVRLSPRLQASKPAELITVQVEAIKSEVREKQPRKAREIEKENRRKLVQQLVEKAKQFGANGPAVIGIVVNRVATARAVFEELRKESAAVLLTGRLRPYDRDHLLQNWLPRIKAGREANPDKVLYVVATQTVEVGANIDFDALVTEAAPLDSLRQRFGRLHRIPDKPAGRVAARAAILIRSDQAKNSEDDPIYGQAIAETWKWLNRRTPNGSQKKKAAKNGQPTTVDFAINQLDPKLPKDSEVMRRLLAPQPEAPLLFPAHLDAWVQTNPMPDPDPDVGPFLHGPAEAAADVQVIWRADLDENNRKAWPDIVRLMPPRIREALPVPLYELRAWLKERKELLGDVADVEGIESPSDRERSNKARRVLRWRGSQDAKVAGPDQIKPGDTVIIPASYGGADQFGWNPESKKNVQDVAEGCLAELIASYPNKAFRRPKLRFRLHPSLLTTLVPEESAVTSLQSLLRTPLGSSDEDEEARWAAVQPLLATLKGYLNQQASSAAASQQALIAAIDALLQLKRPPKIDVYPRHDGLVVSAPISVNLVDAAPAPIEDAEHEEPEGDEASLVPAGREISLADHIEGVKKGVQDFAFRCRLADELKNALALAAEWHDQGKRDRRFQAWLHGSELKALAALAHDKPLAKSGRDPVEWGRADAFGYPRGMRHEFVSIRLLEAAHGKQSNSELFDLARFLIGTHHGFGRAFAPVTKDRNPVQVSVNHDGKTIEICSDDRLYELNSGWVDLFWRMVRRYGWWGLAYLESLLITADHLASAREQQQPESQVEGAVA